jgi:hypothetical protein
MSVHYCAKCAEVVVSQESMRHDTHYDERGVLVVDSVAVTNEPCGHTLITTPERAGDAVRLWPTRASSDWP